MLLSFRYDINGKTKKKKFWFRFVLLLLILVSGLRYRLGVDTTRYLYHFYHDVPNLGQIAWEELSVGDDILFMLLNSTVLTLGCKFYVVQLIHAAFINSLILNYFWKHSNYFFLCTFSYFLICYYVYNMDTMRASMSISVCLYANDYIIEKKWLKGYGLLFVACLFHAQTIAILALPLLYPLLRGYWKGVCALLFSLIIGKLLQDNLGQYLSILSSTGKVLEKAEVYSNSDFYGSRVGNLNYYIASIGHFVFYSIISLIFFKRRNSFTSILKFEPLLMAGLLFLMIQINFYIANRYAAYFYVYFILFIVEFGVGLFNSGAHLSKGISYTRAIVIIVPFYFLALFNLFKRIEWFYPYSSIIERSIDNKRENSFRSETSEYFYTPPVQGEY